MAEEKPKNKLKIDDKEYFLDSLSEEAKGLVLGLRTADAQIKFHQDSLKLFSISKTKMFEDLKKILQNEDPIK